MLLNLPDFSYFGLIYAIKKVLGHSDAWFIFYGCSKSLRQNFYIVNSGNSWRFRESSTLPSNFQMLIKLLSLTSGVWFFLCKPIFIWNLSMCQKFLNKFPTKRVDGFAAQDVPEIMEYYEDKSSQPVGPQSELEYYEDLESSRVNLPMPNYVP